MPTTEFQEVKFKVSLDADEKKITAVSKAFTDLAKIDTKSFEKLQTALEKFSNMDFGEGLSKAAEAVQSINNITEKLNLEKFSKLQQTLSDLQKIDTKNSAKGIERTADAIDRVSEAIDKVDVTKAKEIVDDVLPPIPQEVTPPSVPKAQLPTETDARKELVGEGTVQDTEEKTGRISSFFTRMGEKIKNGFSNAAQAVKNGIKKMGLGAALLAVKPLEYIGDAPARGFAKLKQVLSSAKGTVKQGFTDIAKSFSPASLTRTAFSPITKTVSKLSHAFDGLGKKFSNLMKRMANMALYRVVRAGLQIISKGLKEGIENLYKWDSITGGSFMTSMDQMATSLKYLQNSFGALAAPLLQALAPAIDVIINKIVDAVNWVNQLISSLTGKSSYYKPLKKQTDFTDGFADATEKADKKAKKLKTTILGFDEINALNANKNSNSSSGKDYVGDFLKDYDGMFEEVPIESNIASLADQIKDMVDKQDWKGLGQFIGNKFNEALNNIDFKAAGRKVAEGANAVVQTGYWTLKTIDFQEVGRSGARFLNAFMEAFDFETLGRFLTRGFTSIWDTIIGFFTELDFGLVGQSISNFILGIYRELNEWIEGQDWSQLGATVWQKFKDLFTNIDWGGIVSEMFRLLGNVIRAKFQFIGGLFGAIGKDITDWWNKEIQGANWSETANNLWNAILHAIGNVADWVGKNIVDPFMGALLGKDKWEETKTTLGEFIDKYIKKPWDDLKKWWDEFKRWWDNTWIGKAVNGANGVLKGVQGALGAGFGGKKQETIPVNVEYHPVAKDKMTQNFINNQPYTGSAAINVTDKNRSTNKQFNSMYNTGSVNTSMTANIGTQNRASTVTMRNLVNDGAANTNMTTNVNTQNRASSATMRSLVDSGNANTNMSTSVNPRINTSSYTTSQLVNNGTADARLDMEVNNWSYSNIHTFLTGDPNGVVDVEMRVHQTSGTGQSRRGHAGVFFSEMAKGGAFHNGFWHKIPQYARGTLNAGSMFVAGEAGPELVGHIGSRTEVLNKSQLASAMYSSVQNAMKNFSAAPQLNVATLENLLQKILEAIEIISQKDPNMQITSGEIQRAFRRKAVRAG